MRFRHELKHELNYADLLVVRQRLRAVAKADSHARDGRYFIRSLYFDDAEDTALREKLDGVNMRSKFRIRFYDGDASLIHLEKKMKINGLCAKESCTITAAEAERIVRGDIEWIAADEGGERALLKELYSRMRGEGLRPRVIVDYTREPFVYAPGNVRCTFDYNIRTGLGCVDFLDMKTPTVPVMDDPIILEVKWDDFLPDIIRDAVRITGRRAAAFSKYAACRMYD